MTFGERLKKARIKKGLKQKDIADHLTKINEKVNHSTVSNWERDIFSPDPETIKLLAQYLEVSTDYLLGNDQEYVDILEALRSPYPPYPVIDGVLVDQDTAELLCYQLEAVKEKLLRDQKRDEQ
mgnify:CR=1 FL=1|jgi:transcriptional regulator with XRE-family HTH domain